MRFDYLTGYAQIILSTLFRNKKRKQSLTSFSSPTGQISDSSDILSQQLEGNFEISTKLNESKSKVNIASPQSSRPKQTT